MAKLALHACWLLLAGVFSGAIGTLTAAAQEPTFRVRSDFDTPLNSDGGWAGDDGQEVAVAADQPFRLRLEVEGTDALARYVLQMRRNGGIWQMVEAHDFPHPTREISLAFDGDTLGTIPLGWTVPRAATGSIAVVAEEQDKMLRVSAAGGGMQALYPAPWPLPHFSLAAKLRLPADSQAGFVLLFAYVDPQNYGAVRLDPAGRISVESVIDGHASPLAEQAVKVALGRWQEVEVQFEGEMLQVELDNGAFELEIPLPGGLPQGHTGIGVLSGDTVDLAELAIEGVARTPRVSIVGHTAYADGDQTANILTGSRAAFKPGSGVSLAELTSGWDGAGHHGEFEWPLVIRRHADGPVVNAAGDLFEFRMIESDGQLPVAGAVGRVRLSIPAGHLGGTFVETPGRIGPWQARNGDLYFIMEPTETDNRFMMMKSVDGGRSWQEVDGANRPATGDLESVDSRLVDGRIEIIHQVTRSVRRHVFHTSDHADRPDRWVIRDEIAAQDEAIAQTTSMAVRSDGSTVVFYLADRLHYVMRGVDGEWSAPVEIDPQAAFINTGPQAAAGRDDIVHFAYFSDDGSIWYRRLLPDGTLTARERLAQGAGNGRAEYGAVLPLAYDAETDVVLIIYRLEDGTLWERRVGPGATLGEPELVTAHHVITDAVDSQQPAADIVIHGDRASVLFVDEESRSILGATHADGAWQTPQLLVQNILGSWVRGNILRQPDGKLVYGFVYDAGSDGGAGMNRYAEIPLTSR